MGTIIVSWVWGRQAASIATTAITLTTSP